jgi:PPIC-type PPIASE domain/SurA N-terminal domain
MRLKKLKKPKPIKFIKKHVTRNKDKLVASQFKEAIETLPKITNETVNDHREEILSGARKYIYPLQHSKHRVVIISSSLLTVVVIGFFVYCGLSLYKYQNYSSFIYGVTQVVPFPIAKAGPYYVSYENYLFELKHYIHYYQTQQNIDFGSVEGQQQLDSFKKQALQIVVNDAYVKELAKQNHVNVSTNDINNEINLLKQQNLLGNNNQVLDNVLAQYWGWSLSDFKRELASQLLAQKVVAKLDISANNKANNALSTLNSGQDFASVAKEYSEDNTTSNIGGQFPFTISQGNKDLAPQTLNEIFQLQPGQTSGIINIGTGLEIVKVISNNNGQITAAHILVNFNSINTYIKPLENSQKPHYYLSVN